MHMKLGRMKLASANIRLPKILMVRFKLLIYIIVGTQLIALLIWILIHNNHGSQAHDIKAITKSTSNYNKAKTTSDVTNQYPPMGWNSWNKFHCDGLKESPVRQVADTLVKTGLAKAGYVYVNLDDCWQIDRNATGYIIEDKKRFPNGMKALGNYIHSKGLKFGIYTDQGTVTCERRPGSYGHELQDTKIYAEWGVDYVKNDDCFLHPSGDVYANYKRFWENIKKTGRKMLHSVKGTISPDKAPSVGNIRRVGADIQDDWSMMIASVDIYIKDKLWRFGKPGFYNDLDMLEIGNRGLTRTEAVSHMALWCAFKSPLLMGNDLSQMDDFTLKILMHKELLEILKDPLGEPAKLIYSSNIKSGSAEFRVVTKTCNFSDTHQQWLIGKDGVIKNKASGKCLAANSDGTIIVQTCKDGEVNQKWSRNSSTYQIHPSRNKRNCITARNSEGVDLKVRNCVDRTEMDLVKGPSFWWTTYYDFFHVKYLSKTSSTVAALTFVEDRKCLKVGAPKDIMIFAGRLSKNRYVAVLLNRDVKPHTIRLNFNKVPGLKTDVEYNLRDVWLKKNIGTYKNTFSANVESHATMTLVISKA